MEGGRKRRESGVRKGRGSEWREEGEGRRVEGGRGGQ